MHILQKKKVVFLGLSVLIILVVVMIKQRGKEALNEVKEDTGIPVKVADVETADVRERILVSGDIRPWAEVTIYPEVTGRVERIFVEEGQYIRKGDMVAQIDYEKTVLTVKQIESQLRSAEIKLESLQKDYERMKRLFEQKVVAEKTLDDTKTALESATYSADSLRSQMDLVRMRLKDAKITAPISGVISRKFIDEGEIVTESSMTKSSPLVTIVDAEKVKVTVPVGEKEISRVKKGQRAEITLDAHPDKVFYGEVYNIFPVIDLQTRTAQVEILVSNPERSLKPGMFARTEIVINSRNNVLVIPVDSIIEGGDGKHVFVAEGDRVRLRQIITGLEEGEKIEVVSGLEKGDLLVVEGQHTVKSGERILIVNRQEITK
jgi:membrane fusion protein, multidrug efflux system